MGETIPISHEWSGEQWDWPLQHNDGIVKVINSKDKFEVELEAHQFTPKEIEVKVTGHMLDIHLHHEKRNDQHGAITREVSRTYRLPDDVDASTLKTHLSGRGILTIVANKKH